MKLPSLNKKQIILLASLAAVLIAVLVLVLALSCRPAAEVIVYDDAPEETEDMVVYDDVSDSVEIHGSRGVSMPNPVLTFQPDPAYPMPEEGAVLHVGDAFEIGGTIYANYPIGTVTVNVTSAHNNQRPYPYKRSVSPSGNAGSYDLRSDATEQGTSLAASVVFSDFTVGVHTLRVTASCGGSRAIEVFRCSFYVVGDTWEQITQENFPDSYPEALKFFGSTERFLYRYQWVNGRYILADPEWEQTYITTIVGYPNGEPWRMHVDAVPYMEQAFDYLETSYVRVHGTNGDTGVIPAIALITEYNGCYVSRFTSSLKSISHHTFGTAVDLNASMEPNKNIAENTAVIDDDVKGHLKYNGILEENGVPYYDFTYDGSYQNDPNGVPQTCVNYLLYELGFFRAGFLWAHYYRSTSDAMHFCLSEFVTYHHEHKEYGLRKVFTYAPRVEPTPVPESENIA